MSNVTKGMHILFYECHQIVYKSLRANLFLLNEMFTSKTII